MLFIVILALVLAVTGLQFAFSAYDLDESEYSDTSSHDVLGPYRRW